MKNTLILFAAFLVFLLPGCKIQEDINDLKNVYGPELALPLFYSKFTMPDIVGSKNASTLIIAKDGRMNLFYKSNFTERKASDILKVFGNSIIPLNFQDSLTYSRALYSQEMVIQKIDYKKGTTLGMGVQLLTPNITDPINLKIWIPTLIKAGKQFELSYKGVIPTSTFLPLAVGIDLFGYRLTPFPVNSDSIQLRYSAYTSKGIPVKISVLGAVANPAFDYVEGFMAKRDIEIDNGSVDVSIYNQIIKGDLKFSEPKISVLVENSYGYPMRTKVNLVKAISKKGDTISLVANNLINDGFDFPYPALNEIGATKKLRFDFTNSNSNIKTLLNSGPNTILYSIDAVANPLSLKTNGFMTDSTTLKIGLEVDIPLLGSASNFEGGDTIRDLNLIDLENVEAAEFKFVATNDLPVGITLDCIFLDINGNILDKLTPNPFVLVQAANVNSNGDVIKTAQSETFVPVNADKIAKIKNAKQLLLLGNFSTYDQGKQEVRILSTQQVNLRCGLKIIPKI
ncbi:MAG: hypothetical protein ACOYOA_07410 [Saprospiraceae bacterium]